MVPGFVYAKFNDLEDFASKVTENTIAVMIEPVQGEGGVIPMEESFVKGLEKLCRERDVLLLIDAVEDEYF